MSKAKTNSRRNSKNKKEFEVNHNAENLNQSDNTLKIPQRDKFKRELHIRMRDDLTEKQKALLELIAYKDTRMVFVDGPAGTSKTFLAILAGLQSINSKRMSQLFYVRSIIESASKSLGSLPGEANDKLSPFLMPLEDKLSELLPPSEVEALILDDRVKGMPINYMRGASLNATFLVADEIQNMNFSEIVTLITRQGQYSKFILVGDSNQCDITHGKSGFKEIFDLFDDQESQDNGIFCVKFNHDDIVRSGITKFIIEKLESRPKK